MLFVISIYVAGVAMFFSPCVFPILPVYLSVLERGGKKILNTLLFILGLSLTFITLGFGFGALGQYIYTPTVRVIAGIIVVLLGLQQLEIFNFSGLNQTKVFSVNKRFESPAAESFVLGLTFSLGWTPCVGPILAAVLGYAGDGSSAAFGGLLLSIFVAGFATPFLVFSFFYQKLESHVSFIKRNLDKIKKASAILIILLGLGLIFDKLGFLVAYFNSISVGL